MAVACDDLKPAITQQERMVIAEVYYADDEKNALIRELDRIIDDDRYPLSPVKHYEPPRFIRGRRRGGLGESRTGPPMTLGNAASKPMFA
jgi:hypothetical protein